MRAAVTEDIPPKDGAGKVRFNKNDWDAISFEGVLHKAGTRVEVADVKDGVLAVKRVMPGG